VGGGFCLGIREDRKIRGKSLQKTHRKKLEKFHVRSTFQASVDLVSHTFQT
jgi:hypothetical protein